MTDDTIIKIIDGKFSFERHEGWGYVNNYYDYDNVKLELISSEIIPYGDRGEGADIHKKYNFKLLTNESSIICFITDYNDKKYYEKYAIDINKLIVYVPCHKNYNNINNIENDINNPIKNKCVVS